MRFFKSVFFQQFFEHWLILCSLDFLCHSTSVFSSEIQFMNICVCLLLECNLAPTLSLFSSSCRIMFCCYLLIFCLSQRKWLPKLGSTLKNNYSMGGVAGLVADCPAMSPVLVCWHSRKWRPPLRGGLLCLLVLWLEKLNWIDFFCKIGILYAWGGSWSIKREKKCVNTLWKKPVFLVWSGSSFLHILSVGFWLMCIFAINA